MTTAAETLKSQLASLSEEDRAELAYFLLRSLPPEADEQEDEALVRMLQERMDDIESGRVQTIPDEEARRLFGEGLK